MGQHKIFSFYQIGEWEKEKCAHSQPHQSIDINIAAAATVVSSTTQNENEKKEEEKYTKSRKSAKTSKTTVKTSQAHMIFLFSVRVHLSFSFQCRSNDVVGAVDAVAAFEYMKKKRYAVYILLAGR